jgi:ribosomal protein S18 acetylase RimI-like enzyme
VTGAAGRHAIEMRTATAADAELLADLGARAFSDTFLASTTAQDMAAYIAGAFGPRVQADELADPARTFLIAEADGETAGYVQLKRGESPECVAASRPIEIVRFYADAHWIGRGVGAALMRASLRLAGDEGRDVVWLDVWEENDRAIAFYRKWGFAPVGTARFRIGDDLQNDLVMSRRVDAVAPGPVVPLGSAEG